MRCSVCNASLCVKCFVQFHTISDLVHSKAFLSIELGKSADVSSNAMTSGDDRKDDANSVKSGEKRKRGKGGVFVKYEKV